MLRLDAEPLVGRERELGVVRGFLASEHAAPACLVRGEPGIGKTRLWQEGGRLAESLGWRVLSARPADAESPLSLSVLGDLFDGVELGALDGVPEPQRRALEVALLRAEPAGRPPEERAVALGVLNALRSLAQERPILVAVDDLQWMDAASGRALAFAVRRVDGGTRFLFATRPGESSVVEQSFTAEQLTTVDLGPLSLGAIRHLLAERLGLSLPRYLLRRVVDVTVGNPLFALELGRSFGGRELPSINDDLPLPAGVEELLSARIAGLSPELQRLMLVVSLDDDLRAADLEELPGLAGVHDAVDLGLLVADDGRIRASHPLLAAVARQRSSANELRAAHGELARVARGDAARARHLALATETPDVSIARSVATAARQASARGAAADAVELAQQAVRLTPAEDPDRPERLLELGSYLHKAGELQRLSDVIAAELESIPHGSQRGRAFLLLAEGADVRTLDDYKDRLRDALVEAADDSWLHALVVAKMSSAVIEVERVADAEAAALSVLPAADRADVERAVLFALAWARALRGEAVDDLCERFERAADHDGYLAESPERVAAQRLVWRGDVAEARPRIERMLELADERGEPASYIWARLHLCELELRVGNADPAGRLLDEWAQGAEGEIFVMPVYQRCRALLAICRGSADEAVHWAVDAIASARQVGAQWDWLEGRRARGTALLFRGEAADAVADLNAVWRHAERQQLDEPGVFPVAAELVDALVETGTRVDAERVTERLRNMSERHAHPWGLITADRCGAVIRLAERYDEDAAAALQGSAARYGELGLHHDRARTLLVLGRTQRRHRKWAAARGSLEKAAEAFDGLAAPGWAAQARSELARVGGRRARTGGLTPAERRVAELASEGLSNKEIAAALFVTTKTVETHLSHAYAKLEVRSRAQLARKLGPG